MYNGKIAQLSKTKRAIRESLRDKFYNYIQGTTDSEHAFAVFLEHLGSTIANPNVIEMSRAMTTTIYTILELQKAAGIDEPSYHNFAVTDGYRVVASRYLSQPEFAPPTLYVASGDRFGIRDEQYRMKAAKKV